MPAGAVYVGRPTTWGNSWRVGQRWYNAETLRYQRLADARSAVAAFRQDVGLLGERELADWLAPLRGHDLACWDPLDQPCHADFLLELANA